MNNKYYNIRARMDSPTRVVFFYILTILQYYEYYAQSRSIHTVVRSNTLLVCILASIHTVLEYEYCIILVPPEQQQLQKWHAYQLIESFIHTVHDVWIRYNWQPLLIYQLVAKNDEMIHEFMRIFRKEVDEINTLRLVVVLI